MSMVLDLKEHGNLLVLGEGETSLVAKAAGTLKAALFGFNLLRYLFPKQKEHEAMKTRPKHTSEAPTLSRLFSEVLHACGRVSC